MEERSRQRLIPNPCKPDCPDRTSTCHAECIAYADYAASRRLIHERRLDTYDINNLEHERHRKRNRRCYNE